MMCSSLARSRNGVHRFCGILISRLCDMKNYASANGLKRSLQQLQANPGRYFCLYQFLLEFGTWDATSALVVALAGSLAGGVAVICYAWPIPIYATFRHWDGWMTSTKMTEVLQVVQKKPKYDTLYTSTFWANSELWPDSFLSCSELPLLWTNSSLLAINRRRL